MRSKGQILPRKQHNTAFAIPMKALNSGATYSKRKKERKMYGDKAGRKAVLFNIAESLNSTGEKSSQTAS